MESRSKQIDESPDELLQLVRHHVEDVLHEYYQKNGVKTDYDIRDIVTGKQIGRAHV